MGGYYLLLGHQRPLAPHRSRGRRDGKWVFMSIDRRHVAISVTVAAVLSAAAAAFGQAEVAADAFYSGRQVNLIVGYGPGGGYDLTARLVARHIGRFIP